MVVKCPFCRYSTSKGLLERHVKNGCRRALMIQQLNFAHQNVLNKEAKRHVRDYPHLIYEPMVWNDKGKRFFKDFFSLRIEDWV